MTDHEEVELERDHYWWLHPALRGREAVPAASALPWQWLASPDDVDDATPVAIDSTGPFGDFAKLLYKLNGYRPGMVTGWYVIVCPEPDRYAVGQLCVDPEVPLRLFESLVFGSEDAAREKAAALRAKRPGLLHK